MKAPILIADDEGPARRTLREYLRQISAAEVLEAADGKTAIATANRERPDLIFLDIVMPGATGLEVLSRLDYEPKVIFTTAHDEYAVTAFELGALDYVLKPFARDRLELAMQRAQATLAGSAVPLLSRANESLQPVKARSRIFFRDGGRIIPIPLAGIERIQGADDYVTIHTAAKEYLVGIRLSDLEHYLKQSDFLRIHRSHLINLEYVTAIDPYDATRLQVSLKSGVRIVASRAGSRQLRNLAL